MRKIFGLVIFVFAVITASAQNQVNPATQVRWPAVTGAGAPSGPTWVCSAANYGQPYTDTAVGNQYVCGGSGGWVEVGGSGAGPYVKLAPSADQTITGTYSLIMPVGRYVVGTGTIYSQTAFEDVSNITVPGRYSFLAAATLGNIGSTFGNAAFDANYTIANTALIDHHNGYQRTEIFNGSGNINTSVGFLDRNVWGVGAGTVTTYSAFEADTPNLSSGGSIGTYYGLSIGACPTTLVACYGIFSSAPVTFSPSTGAVPLTLIAT